MTPTRFAARPAAVLACLFILALLGGHPGLVMAATPPPTAEKAPVSIEDVWAQYRFYYKPVGELHWWHDGRHLVRLQESGDLVRYRADRDEPIDTLVAAARLRHPQTKEPLEVEAFVFSARGRFAVLSTQVEPIYRHSATQVAYVFDRERDTLMPLNQGNPIQEPTLDPTGRRVAYLVDNNIRYVDLQTGQVTPVTTTGVVNKLRHGHADWVYEEEFSMTKTFAWRPDGSALAYLSFDEAEVPEYSLTYYRNPGPYPRRYHYKYPKAGERNATVSGHVFHLADGATTRLDLLEDPELYYPRLQWTPGGERVAVTRLNRHQNRLDVLLADPMLGDLDTLFTETSQTYVDLEQVDPKLRFLEDGTRFLWFTEAENGYMHAVLYRYNATNGQPASRLHAVTTGPWEITEVYGVDENKGWLYYQCTAHGALERHIYRSDLAGKRTEQLSEGEGWHTATFGPGMVQYVHTYSNSLTAPRTRLVEADGTPVRDLEVNDALQRRLATYAISTPEYITMPAADDRTVLNGMMIKPTDFDPAKRYPVLMFCYGGPNRQTVTKRYDPLNFFWFQHLASMGYIVVSVDNRGTGGRGAAFKTCTYQDLGNLEHQDQVAAAKHLAKLDYVDGSRMGIWGWSFGGYLTSLCLMKTPDVFKLGIAVAPVTNWRFYDTIYTERFLRTPQENPEGYDRNSPLQYADRLKNHYFLIHGLADDNVHPQNAWRMVDALVGANKPFRHFIYPDRNHGIYGGPTRLHLYRMMTEYIQTNL